MSRRVPTPQMSSQMGMPPNMSASGRGAPPQQPPSDTIYAIAVKTSDLRNAGTDANVYVQLTGETGIGPQIQLKTSINHRNKFERNHSDVFIFPGQKPLGTLRQVKIWHDNSGVGAGWHLQVVEVHDAISNTIYVFPCNQWLDKAEGDKQICRMLACERTKQKMPKHLKMAQEQMQQQQPQEGQYAGQAFQGGQSGQWPSQMWSPQQQQQPWQVNPQTAPRYQSPLRKASSAQCQKPNAEPFVILPAEAPQFHMMPYGGGGYGFGNYGYPGYGGYYGGGYSPYAMYGMYGYPNMGYGYGYGSPAPYGGGYGYGYGHHPHGMGGVGAFGAGMMFGGFMGRSWSWSFF